MGQACAQACGTARRQYGAIGVGLALAFGAELAEWLGLEGILPIALASAAILLAGRGVLWQGIRALMRLRPNIYLLMTLASAGALALGRWGEAAFVLTLYALAELLEQRAAERSERSLRAALEIAPAEATVQTPDGEWRAIPAAQIRVGQRVRIKPGERVPIDGVVRAGASTVDQSPLTGESVPVEKAVGDTVYAGSLNLHGSLEVEASTTAEGTLMAHIARVVAQAQARRAQVDRLMDRFAQVYTPLMLVLATGVALLPPLLLGAPLSEWLYRGLVFLVLGCPCALVISTPVTLLCALTALARQGVVVKGAVVLEQAARLRAFAFDKTGTLTYGSQRIETVQSPISNRSMNTCRSRLASRASRNTQLRAPSAPIATSKAFQQPRWSRSKPCLGWASRASLQAKPIGWATIASRSSTTPAPSRWRRCWSRWSRRG
jgi:Cd2+/Zn2+-exporting ATPase